MSTRSFADASESSNKGKTEIRQNTAPENQTDAHSQDDAVKEKMQITMRQSFEITSPLYESHERKMKRTERGSDWEMGLEQEELLDAEGTVESRRRNRV